MVVDQLREEEKIFKQLLAGKPLPILERQLCHKDGGLIQVEANLLVVKDEEDHPLYVQCLARDVTNQKRTEKHLKSSLSELVLLATTDPLTGLDNRRTIESYLENTLRQAQNSEQPLSIILADMDNLKSINDKYGHSAGDFALRKLAKLIQANMRSADLAGRWAGDEFLLVLPDTDINDAYGMAVRLQEKLQESLYLFEEGKEIPIHVSMGLASAHQGETPLDMETLVDWADQALYAAKDKGRNRVEIYLPA